MNTPHTDRRSALYDCRVLHERRTPKRHRFSYGLFYLAVDLDELPALHRGLRLFSANAANVCSVHEDDHLRIDKPAHNPSAAAKASAEALRWEKLPSGAGALKTRVRAYCEAHGLPLEENCKVVLVALPRLFGYAFNPVVFLHCSHADGRPACTIAEVTNTYREQKAYFIPLEARAETTGAALYHARVPKHFYVSPFSSLETHFDFTLRQPGRTLAARIDDHQEGACVLHSVLHGTRRELSDASLAGALLRHPLLTPAVMAKIHWQALRLWLKRVPHFRKADGDQFQRDLRNPFPQQNPQLTRP